MPFVESPEASPSPGVARTTGRGLFFAALALVATGCAQCAPEKVGTGVARLTVRNVGAMVSLVNADTTCGFASDAVKSAPTIEGEVGGEGSLTFTVTDCAIDVGDGLELSKSCTGGTTTAKGKLTISASRTVTGLLTGNPASPIIPNGPDALTIKIVNSTFENFVAESSTSEKSLKLISGSLSATLKPRLAVSAGSGACAIATPNIAFTEIRYGASKVFVDTPDNKFDVEVDESVFAAQNGTDGEATNTLAGTISVWGSDVTVPERGDEGGLDPDFELAKFEEGYACTPDLATPVSYTCADLGPRLAGGVARLTTRTIGTITSLIDANATCGFSSPAVGGTPTFTGNLGDDGSTATFTIATGCTITLPDNTPLGAPDCAGVVSQGSGSVTVTGTKKVTGFRTGNPQRPIVPTSRDPAEFDLTLTFDGFKVTNSASTASLRVKTGTLTGKVAPRVGLDLTTGACSISTPIVTFSDLSWSNANVRLETDGNRFDLSVGASSLNAQNGTKESASNTISGAVTVDGTSYSLAGEPLDVAFNQANFDASFACKPNLLVAPNDATCSFRGALGPSAARLVVKTLATAASALNGDTGCGFSSSGVLTAPTNVTGNPGEMGSITWTVMACQIGPIPADTTLSPNCLGGFTKGSGTIVGSGDKTVVGIRNTNPPIIPVTREAATLPLSLALTSFEVYDLAPGATTPNTSSILSGTAGVTLNPVGGESASAGTTPSVYSISTPVASIESILMPTGTLIIRSEGNQFNLGLSDVSLNAFNGTYDGRSNFIVGSLKVDGIPVSVPMGPLDPTFDQATFDSKYVCANDLKEVVPSM